MILSLCTRAPSDGTAGGGNGSICVTGLSTVHLPSTILHGTPIALLMASLSHLSCCSILLTSRALNTPSAVSTMHSALLFLTPNHSEFVSGIHAVQRISRYCSRQHLLSEWYKFLCRLLAMQPYQWRRTVSTLQDLLRASAWHWVCHCLPCAFRLQRHQVCCGGYTCLLLSGCCCSGSRGPPSDSTCDRASQRSATMTNATLFCGNLEPTRLRWKSDQVHTTTL